MGLLDIFKKKCPECKSTDIENLGEKVIDQIVREEFKCNACDHQWAKETELKSPEEI